MACCRSTEMPDQAGHDGLGVRYDVGMTLG